MQPITLTEPELDQVLNLVSPTGVDYQAGRICRLLSRKSSVRTGYLASVCSVGNISDIVQKSINPKIEPLGLFVSCFKPPERLNNKFGQRTGDHYWSLYRHAESANDDLYDDDLAIELEAVIQKYPGVAGESDASDWVSDLSEAT